MTDKNHSEVDTFISKYRSEEKNLLSLRNLFYYDINTFVLLSANHHSCFKEFWTTCFNNYVLKNEIKNYSRAEPYWNLVKDFVYEILNSSNKGKKKSSLQTPEKVCRSSSSSSHSSHLSSSSSKRKIGIEAQLSSSSSSSHSSPSNLKRKIGIEAQSSSSIPPMTSSSQPSPGDCITSSGFTSTESTGKRRKKIVNYLQGKDMPVITLENSAAQWELNHVNITKHLIEYRELSFERARINKVETIQEELSLNSIYLIDGIGCIENSRIEYGFDTNTWKLMTDECIHDMYHLEELSNRKVEESIHDFIKAGRRDVNMCKQIANTVPVKDISGDGECIQESLFQLAKMYSIDSSDKSGKMESSFTLDSIYPIFVPFLQESAFITRKGTDGQCVGSSERRSKNLEENKKKGKKKVGRFADISMIYDYGGCPQQGLVVVEIKPPMKVLDHSRPDFIKLANEMKDSIDKMVKDGYDDDSITVIGVLIEGFTCTLFIMDLVYQAIYRMIPLSVFYIPRSHHDYSVLPATYEALITLKKYMLSNARKCFAFHRRTIFQQSIRSKYIVESLNTPENHNSKNND